MTVFGLPVTCPVCGGLLTLVNGSAASITLSVAVLECSACDREFEVTARLTPMPVHRQRARQRKDAA